MKHENIDENTIREALSDHTVNTLEEARLFMMNPSPDKLVSDRLISWLISFKIIPLSSDTWTQNIKEMYDNYYIQTDSAFSTNPEDPISHINQTSYLRKDLARTVTWFNTISADVGVTTDDLPNALFRLSRIYSLIIVSSSDISYMQGLDRYGSVMLVCTANFCKKKNISMDFAEAMAFYLTRAVLVSIPFLKTFASQINIKEHFTRVDSVLQQCSPQQYNTMIENDSSTVFFGCRWEMMLFADEHSGIELLILWDQIFARLEKIDSYVPSLTVAHVMQIDIPPDCVSVNEIVLHYRDWNMKRLFDDAQNILMHERTNKEKFFKSFCPCCPHLHGYDIINDQI